MKTSPTLWDRWYRRVLPAYWVFLFCSTHFPRLSFEGPVAPPPALAHLAAFALLAFLLWRFAETFQRPLSGRFVWIALVCLAAYGALDEYLQFFVGRSAAWGDWLCDVAGSAIVLGLLEFQRRVRQARAASSPEQTLDSASVKK
jgi:VanZ family protein